MSTYDSGQRVSNFVRNGAGRVPTPRLTESLDAPGLVAAPPEVTSGQRVAYDIIQSLGAVDRIADSTSQIARIQYAVTRDQQAEIDRQTAEDRRLDAEALDLQQSLYEAQQAVGVNSYRDTMPSLADTISQATVIVPPDLVENYVKGIIAQNTDGMDPAAAEAYARNAGPALTTLVLNKNKELRELAAKQETDSRLNAARSPLSADVEDRIDGIAKLNPTTPRSIIAAEVYGRHLSFEADAGTPESFATAKAKAKENGVNADDLLKADNDFKRTQFNRYQVAKTNAERDLAIGLTAARDGETSLDFVEQQYRARHASALDPVDLRQGLQQIDAAKLANRQGVEAEAKRLAKAQWTEDVLSRLSTIADSASETGGLAVITDKKFESTVKLPNGDEMPVDITREAAVSAIVERKREQLGTSMPPEKAFDEFARWLALNGADSAYIKQVMGAGAAIGMSEVLNAQKPGDDIKIPKNMIAGYSMYKRLSDVNPIVRDRHLDEQSSRIYDIASVAEKYITPGDPAAALAYAVRAEVRRSKPEFQQEHLDTFIGLSTAVDTWWPFDRRDITNSVDVYGRVKGLAETYMNAVGLGPSAAVDAAKKNIASSMRVVNGWAIDTQGRNAPENMDEISKMVVSEYVGGLDKKGVYDPNDLTLMPYGNDRWIMWVGHLSRPVDDWAKRGTFTDADIFNKSGDAKAKSVRESRAKQPTKQQINDALQRRMDEQP